MTHPLIRNRWLKHARYVPRCRKSSAPWNLDPLAASEDPRRPLPELSSVSVKYPRASSAGETARRAKTGSETTITSCASSSVNGVGLVDIVIAAANTLMVTSVRATRSRKGRNNEVPTLAPRMVEMSSGYRRKSSSKDRCPA